MKRKNTDKPDRRCATCPRWDRWHIRIPNPEDQQKLIELYLKSGAKTKSDYFRGQLLNQSFKVITQDKAAEPYLRELDSIISLTRRIGILYNEAVKTLNSYHSVKTAQRMIRKLEVYSEALIKLQIQAIQLTNKFQEQDRR
jgi:hypothetical protein